MINHLEVVQFSPEEIWNRSLEIIRDHVNPRSFQTWFAPLVTSRLANGLSTPIAVQNLSGGSIPVAGSRQHKLMSPAISTIT